MTQTDMLVTLGLIVAAFAILLMAANTEHRRKVRDAKHRNEDDGSIVIRPFQQAHPMEKEEMPAARAPRGRIDDNDRPKNLKGW